MKLTYWVCENLYDRQSYNIRATTRREALRLKAMDPDGYGPVKKVTVEYDNGFELVNLCLGEGGAYWEQNN
jgi:hypothetical protein